MKRKTDIVDRVELKFPNIFKLGTEDYIKHKLNMITKKKSEMSAMHMQYMELEKEIEALKEEIKPLLPLVDVIYEEVEVEDKIHGECNLLIDNPNDARYSNYGFN